MNRNLRYFVCSLVGITAGAIGMVLGAYLASSDNGWVNAFYFSAAGVIGAPLASLSWAAHRVWRIRAFAGAAVAIGLLATTAIVIDLAQQYIHIAEASARAPVAFTSWLVIWCIWISVALTRLLMSQPLRKFDGLAPRRTPTNESSTGALRSSYRGRFDWPA